MVTKTKRINMNRLMKTQACIILAVLVLIGGIAGFFVGKWTNPVKTVTFTETVEVPAYEADKLPNVEEIVFYDIPLSRNLQQYLHELCADEGVPVTLVLAMIDHESGFNQEIISSTNDYGLMQINEINHSSLEEKYQCEDMLNPYQNVFCGVKIIGTYLKKYNNDYTKALMSYNMGEYGAKKAWNNGINSSNYTVHVLGLWQKYEEVNGNATSVINE